MASTAPPADANGVPQATVVVDVRTIHAGPPAQDEGSTDGSSSLGAHSIGGHFRAVVRDYCLSCVPPHIRRKGLAIPPFRVRGRVRMGV